MPPKILTGLIDKNEPTQVFAQLSGPIYHLYDLFDPNSKIHDDRDLIVTFRSSYVKNDLEIGYFNV